MGAVENLFDDRLKNIQCEVGVLAAIITYVAAREDIDQLNESLFTMHTHRIMFRAIKKLHDAGSAVDGVMLLDSIKSLGGDAFGVNEQYVIDLLAEAPAWLHHFPDYVRKLQELAARRALRDAAEKTKVLANDLSNGNADEAIAKATSLLGDIGTGNESDSIEHIVHATIDVFSEVAKIQEEKEKGIYKVRGVTTGFFGLDTKLIEAAPGDLILIAARPSMGKTAFAQNIAAHISTNLAKPILFESCEMKKAKIARRFMAAMGNVELKRLHTAELRSEDWQGIQTATMILEKAPIELHDGDVTLSDIRRHARQAKKKYGSLGAIFVDYLQLINTPNLPENTSEHARLTYVSKGLKNIAMEFDCPLFALSQLSRDVEKRPNKRPVMSDLRGSGALEQDADVILFLYRDEYYNKDKSKFIGLLEVDTAKCRDGVTGKTFLCAELEYSRFSNVASHQLASLEKMDGAA
ncbi:MULTISPECIES: replicative DNA helicase [Acinetobacter]|uniref:DNA 5'-3' helicase n=1 Tax=Acinetobacter corruptisaponis TaxID=3045147 RepID=A0ABY8S247_9GAMM|nr:DnaB-like helicase C-terminal domain-containing protein [Acinetobacter sp. KCTC 92772]WHP05773.1 DnaB-like helicase C-terminal domain-containing protein [Acinetobacter sp. KCTC 92772]